MTNLYALMYLTPQNFERILRGIYKYLRSSEIFVQFAQISRHFKVVHIAQSSIVQIQPKRNRNRVGQVPCALPGWVPSPLAPGKNERPWRKSLVASGNIRPEGKRMRCTDNIFGEMVPWQGARHLPHWCERKQKARWVGW